MKKLFIIPLCFSMLLTAYAQQPTTETKPQEKPAPIRQAAPVYPNFINPPDVNVRLSSDVRTFVVMAALNVAGFDYEPGGQPLTPARAALRKDLAAKVTPELKQKLSDFYKAHRRPNVDEGVDATRYAALSFLMTQPPAFTVYQREGTNIPEDVKPLLGFGDLVRVFYVQTNIKELVPKYLGVGEAYATEYRRPVGELLYQVLTYFNEQPETVINMKPVIISSGDPAAKTRKETVMARTRTRQVFIVFDPLASLNSSFARDDMLNAKDDLLSRRVGDDYLVAIGPSRTLSIDAIRNALIRFVIDPLIERHLKTSLEYREPLLKLVKAVPTATKEYQASVYQVLRESLARAAEARLKRRLSPPTVKGVQNDADDEATYELAQAYLRGAVLAFHFYEQLKGLEQVGIRIEDFYDQMLATFNAEKEEKRAAEFEPVVARVSAKRRKAGEASMTADPAIGAVMKKILESDDLIRQKRFVEARATLEEVLAVEPKNARALYGLARIYNQSTSKVEADASADENDRIQAQHNRLEATIKLYRKVIENASPVSEKWLIQWSYVLIGRIYDFQEFRQDAINEYDKAIAMNDVPNGAYKEALEGKQKPHGQKQ